MKGMPDDRAGETRERLSVREFAAAPELGLKLEVLYGGEGLANEIRSARIQKLGLALAGFTDYLHPNRVQVLGGSELNYLEILNPEARRNALLGLRDRKICCILMTKGLAAPEDLLALASAAKIPVLRSTAPSSLTITRIGDYLDRRLAPRIAVHGALLDVFGLGVLLLGPSGIGKSECALELIVKGHRLVADDYIEITRSGVDCLTGSGGPVLRYHMELRGLGIIDIKELFGISATGHSQAIHIVIRLERWREDEEYDRLGLDQSAIEFLGIPVPLIEMPVAPGRNVATLVEIAARIQLLRQRGFLPSRELPDLHLPAPAAEGVGP